MTQTPSPDLSIVVPVYNEAGNIVPLVAEIREVMLSLHRPFEIVYVNDGSTDATGAQLRALAATEPRLRIIDLDGNFGEAAALSAGFRAARGAVIVTLDGDGQNDPRDIPDLLAELERGYAVVTGWRRARREGWWLRVVPSRLANRLIAALSGVPVHDNGCGLKVYRREIVTRAVLPPGMHRFIPAIFGVTAGQVAERSVNDRHRQAGQSHYGIGRALVVLRDVCALPFIIGNQRGAEPTFAGIGATAACIALYGAWNHHYPLSGIGAALAFLGLVIWWNLRRFNRAQREGVYRVRRQGSAAEGL